MSPAKLNGSSVSKTLIETKRCPRCGETKKSDEWPKHANRADGLGSNCSSCMAQYSKERRQRPEVKDAQRIKDASRYAKMSKEERSNYIRQGTERRRSTAYNLSSKYGMSSDDYDTLLHSQGGGCAICGKPPSTRRLAVDHDHLCCPGIKTCGNCVRGLLCVTCNVWLGFFENPEWRARAEEYLEKEASNA
jgi:uncharacterized C2H2 Zn-finger protein